MDESQFHPLFRELKLVNGTESGNVGDANYMHDVSPLRVLDHLLKSSVVREEDIRKSADVIRSRFKKNQKKSKSSTTKNQKKEQESEPDRSRVYRCRHIALRLFYDGSSYSGLAQNIGQESDNSIEKALFKALLKARLVESREACKYSRCGRTDRGVSAAGQVISMHLKSSIPPDASLDEEGQILISDDQLPKNEFETVAAYCFPRKNLGQRVEKKLAEYPYAKILNNLLPPAIRILGWAPVSGDFSARFSASSRLYRYFFVKRQGMDLEKAQHGLDLLTGKHDFRNFCKMDVEKVYNFERTIHSAKIIERSDPIYYIQIQGQAFLWHQIRYIASVIFMIAYGLESPGVITELLNIEKYPGKPNYQLASESPLVLHDCDYTNLCIGYSVQNLWSISCQFEQQWEDLVLAAARIRNGIDSLKEQLVSKAELWHFATSKLSERSRKLRRTGQVGGESEIKLQAIGSDESKAGADAILWSDALIWLKNHQLIPDAGGLDTTVHTPLVLRSKGTTYEQKIESLKNSEKRRQKFEENVIKKRKTAQEDAEFYKHMTEQGGTGI